MKPFQSSGKIRLNANGRKLDAWLIYKCRTCDKTWNRPIFERRALRSIDPATLDALQSNDPDWIRAQAFDAAVLRGKSQRVDEFSDVELVKEIRCAASDWTRLEIEVQVLFPTALRLDRLLAAEFSVSRSRLKALHDSGIVKIEPNRDGVLRRRLSGG